MAQSSWRLGGWLARAAALMILGGEDIALAQPHGVGEDGVAAATTVAVAATPGRDWQRAVALPGWMAVVTDGVAAERKNEPREPAVAADGSVEVSLRDTLRYTLENNLNLRVAGYTPRLSAEDIAARQAIFDPAFTFTLDLLKSTSPSVGVLSGAEVLTRKEYQWNFGYGGLLGPGTRYTVGFANARTVSNSSFNSVNPANDANLSFAVSQPLLRNFGFGVTKAEIRIATTHKQQADEGFRAEVIDTVAQTINAYWGLHESIEARGVAEKGVALAEELLNINRTRVQVGTMAPLDISQAEAQVSDARLRLLTARDLVRDTEDRLRLSVGVSATSRLWDKPIRPVDMPSLDEVKVDVNDAIAEAYRHRPELKQSTLNLDIDAVRLEVAKSQLKPGLNLAASLGTAGVGGPQVLRDGLGGPVIGIIPGGYGDALADAFGFDFRTWHLGLTFDLPLHNTAAEAQHAAAVLSMQRDKDAVENLKLTIAAEVRKAVRNVQTNRERVDLARITREYHEKSLDAERKKFDHGLSTNFEVLTQQNDFITASEQEVVARTLYKRALVELQKASGTLLETYDVAFDAVTP